MKPLQDSSRTLLFYGILMGIGALYFAGIGANSIWTTHESYYAVAVREMLERGNWWDITFNGEPRLNKPPMTYWLMAASASLFGLHEWALRLPIVLTALGTLFLVYRLGTVLFQRQVGWIAMLLMAASLQFAWLKHYASPEIPLTFFFTLTLYGFVQGFIHRKPGYLILAFGALALTMLTKGWPYFIIIHAILLVFLLAHHRFRVGSIVRAIPWGWFIVGNLMALAVGVSWIGFMYLKYDHALVDTLQFETTQRLVRSNQHSFWKRWFFYPEVALWSFFPGSLALYYAIGRYARGGRAALQSVALPMAWLAVMLVVFTISQGKLPVYILQAHPAMALLSAYFIVNVDLQTKKMQRIWQFLWVTPTVVALIAAIGLLVAFDLFQGWYVAVGLVIVFGQVQYLRRQWYNLPFVSILATFVTLGILFVSLYPQLEEYRPYRAIRQSVVAHQIPSEVPLVIEQRFIHNLPYYTQRRVLRDQSYGWPEIIEMGNRQSVLALVDVHHELPPGYQLLWKGWLYKKGSESHGFRFVLSSWKARQGNYEHFQQYQLVYYDRTKISEVE